MSTEKLEKLVNQDRPTPATPIVDGQTLLAEHASASPPIMMSRVPNSSPFPGLSSMASGLKSLSSSLGRSLNVGRALSPSGLRDPVHVDQLGRLSFPSSGSDTDDFDNDNDAEDDNAFVLDCATPDHQVASRMHHSTFTLVETTSPPTSSSSADFLPRVQAASSSSSDVHTRRGMSQSSSSSSDSSSSHSSSSSNSSRSGKSSSSDGDTPEQLEPRGAVATTLTGDTPELQTLRVMRFVETPVGEEYLRSLPTRPPNLAPKNEEEEAKHRREYLEILRQQKEKIEKAAAEQRQREEELAYLRNEWRRVHSMGSSTWTASALRASPTIEKLIWQGVPANWRPLVWDVLVGNMLHISEEQFNECAEAGHRREVKGVSGSEARQQILLDLPRTFPQLKIFTPDGPLNHDLLEILEAFRIIRPDIGYVQGMSYVGGMLLMNMEKFLAFRCLTHILARPFFVALYRMEMLALNKCFSALEMIVANRMPYLATHFRTIDLQYQSFALDWFTTIFSRSFPFDTAALVWDLYMYFSTPILFCTAFAILRILRRSLLSRELDGCFRILNRLHVKWDAKELLHEIHSVILTDAEIALIRSIGSS